MFPEFETAVWDTTRSLDLRVDVEASASPPSSAKATVTLEPVRYYIYGALEQNIETFYLLADTMDNSFFKLRFDIIKATDR